VVLLFPLFGGFGFCSICFRSRSYTWDFDNRLLSVAVPWSGTVTFKYDPFGRRIQKVSGNGVTNYVYDGANVVAEVDASGNVLASYVQGAGIDEPLAMSRGGATAYYQADGLGSITSLGDATGNPLSTYTYDSFGQSVGGAAGIANPYQYTARELDSETGLYYYRARYYDPTIGRFISEDPIGFAGRRVAQVWEVSETKGAPSVVSG
jgi:RHS repeat-associated protein